MTKPKDCNHDWLKSHKVYTSSPPQWDEICKRCGEIRRVFSRPSAENTFDKIYKIFHGDKK
jgi:hypothetical protein